MATSKNTELKETDIWQADSNEAGLRTDMVSAIRASQEFTKWIFKTVCPNKNESNLTAIPHVEQRLYNSIIDIDLHFKGNVNYRFGFELKNGTAEVHREQLERHLIGLRIMQKNRKVLTKFASNEARIVKLVVITGSSKMPTSVKELISLNGFEDKIVWMSWHKIVDSIGKLPQYDQNNPNIKPLVQILMSMGFASSTSSFQKFNNINKISKLLESIAPFSTELDDEFNILDAILHRIDYEMNRLNYGPSQSMRVINLPRGKTEKRFVSFLPNKLTKKIERTNIPKWIGRMYVPKDDILSLSKNNESKKITYGVAIGYNIVERKWFCHIEPKPKTIIDKSIFSNPKFKSIERIPTIDINGWELKGSQLNPTKTSKFLKKVWDQYCDTL